MICNIKVEFRGVEKIPAGPLIVAAKHQSMWETFALLQFFDTPLYILKRELKWIPIFGWYLIKADMIEVDRGAGGRALVDMARRAGEEVRRGRQLIIFPEGTRTRGRRAAELQDRGRPDLCGLQRALPAGGDEFGAVLAAPPHSCAIPARILVEFLDVMPAGLPRKEFLEEVAYAIEDASNRLIEDGAARTGANCSAGCRRPLSKPPQRVPSAPVY